MHFFHSLCSITHILEHFCVGVGIFQCFSLELNGWKRPINLTQLFLISLFSLQCLQGSWNGKRQSAQCIFIAKCKDKYFSTKPTCRIYNFHPPTLLVGRQTLPTPDQQPVYHQHAVAWTCWEASFRLTPFSATGKSSFFLHWGRSWTPSCARRQSREDGEEKEKYQREVRKKETGKRKKRSGCKI